MKFALIRFDTLGDVILATPVIRNLRQQHPEAAITVVTRRPYDELFHADPDVNRVVAVGGRLDRDGVAGLRAAAHALAGERFDAVLDLQDNYQSRYLSRRLSAHKRARPPRVHWNEFKLVHLKRFAKPLAPKVDRFNAVLPQVKTDIRTRLPEIRLSEAARAWAYAQSARTRRESQYTTMGVHPGAHWSTKRWPVESFAECVSRVAHKERSRVFLFGSTPERALLEHTAALLPDLQTVVYCGLPLQRVGALVEHCDVFLANDSGLMHLSAALSVPTVSIFGPTHPALGFAPQGPRNRIYFGYAHCSPCSVQGERACYQRRRFCLDRIDPARVAETLSELLTEGKVVGERISVS
jgi:ADP-heptose:LPS heptosyltransferase